MQSLRVMLNGQVLAHVGTEDCTSLSWDVICCRHEQQFAHVSVQGMIRRTDDQYDHPYWVESYPLSPGDTLEFLLVAGPGSTQIARLHTHEQLVSLQQEVALAEAAGEYESARSAEKPIFRSQCSFELRAGSQVRAVEALGSVTTAICSGMWSTDIRPDEWRLRAWAMPVEEASPGFWVGTSGGAHVVLQA